MLNDAVVRQLRARLGYRQFHRRIAIEEGRIEEHRRPISPHFSAFKLHIVRPILAFGLRLLGMYHHGNRHFRAIRLICHTLALRDLPPAFEGYRILHLSDLHIDLDPTLVKPIIEAIEGVQYDLCVMTGDYRNSTVGGWDEAVTLMAQIRAAITAPIYAILGNHDFLGMVPPLEALGIRFLLNESVSLHRATEALYLLGIDDPNIYRTHSLKRALRAVPLGAPALLLSHSPLIYATAARLGIRAVLAGHTHGGQVCLPGGYILKKNDASPRYFWRGPWHFQGVNGYTSPGTGSCGLPIRIHCPPEVTLHTLTRP